MSNEADLRNQMAQPCASQFRRSFSVGPAGNVSAGPLLPEQGAEPGGKTEGSEDDEDR